ncbi:MAG: hypothetical protein KatS3mg105_1650 [Gemmatales bacterium]|nr:MAG: hypothetical protein KatS3mg105_1650 [Gemmatales bacterium]
MAEGQFKKVVRRLRRLAAGHAPSESSDGHLLERFVRGETSAFEQIMHRHGPMVWSVCRRILDDVHAAEDALQATFMALIRQAPSLETRQSLGGWLHRVAYRVATKARVQAARRQTRERHWQEQSMTSSDPQPNWSDLRPVLDEELDRLPEKYRLPVVLCYLEGKTNDQAAEQLGWPLGTVAGRLARARDLLRNRLARRGVALTSTALLSLLGENAHAALPGPLAERTCALAAQVAAGGSLPPSIAALTEAALRVIKIATLQKLVACAVAFMMVATVGIMSIHNSEADAIAPDSGNARSTSQAASALKLFVEASDPGRPLHPVRDDWQFGDRLPTPVTLKLTFTNTGSQPIKLDHYDLLLRCLDVKITGPDEQSVRTIRMRDKTFTPPLTLPRPEVYPTLQPGQSISRTVAFPGRFGSSMHVLTKSGKYKVRFLYISDGSAQNEFSKGCWQGQVESNEITLTAIEN